MTTLSLNQPYSVNRIKDTSSLLPTDSAMLRCTILSGLHDILVGVKASHAT